MAEQDKFQEEIGQYPYSSRYLCSILDDMRKAHKSRNYSYLSGLIEEMQYRANRMESAMELINDIPYMEKRRISLKEEIEKLKKEAKELRKETGNEETYM